jgi:hypothetical protein
MSPGFKFERLRILGAAAALGEFTVPRLAAFSGANENTIRSVLLRDRNLFEVVAGVGQERGIGRPPQRLRALDVSHIRALVRDLERSLGPLIRPLELEPESELDRLAAVVVAEDAVERAWGADDSSTQQLLALTALESLSQARSAAGEQPAANDALDRRTESIGVFAELALAQAHGQQLTADELRRAAEALANLNELAPERIPGLLTSLVVAAIRNKEMPPIVLVTESNVTPTEAILGLDEHAWTRHTLPGRRQVVWTQRWAEPLLNKRLMAGVVVHDAGTAEWELDEKLALLPEWNVPAVVVSRRHSMEAVARVAEAGAFFVPFSAGWQAVAGTLRSALGHTGRSASIHRISSK